MVDAIQKIVQLGLVQPFLSILLILQHPQELEPVCRASWRVLALRRKKRDLVIEHLRVIGAMGVTLSKRNQDGMN